MGIMAPKEGLAGLSYWEPLHFPVKNFEILSRLSVHDTG